MTFTFTRTLLYFVLVVYSIDTSEASQIILVWLIPLCLSVFKRKQATGCYKSIVHCTFLLFYSVKARMEAPLILPVKKPIKMNSIKSNMLMEVPI